MTEQNQRTPNEQLELMLIQLGSDEFMNLPLVHRIIDDNSAKAAAEAFEFQALYEELKEYVRKKEPSNTDLKLALIKHAKMRDIADTFRKYDATYGIFREKFKYFEETELRAALA